MNFKEIDELSLLVVDLDGLRSSAVDLGRFDAIKTKILTIANNETLSSQFVESVQTINPRPQTPYYREVADTVRRESWEVGVTRLNNSLQSLILELRKNAVIVTSDDLDAIMDAGLENEYFEFKSSLRWDVFTLQVNTDLEFVVLKTIAAFANSHGGNLLIGVNDEGNVLGLQGDYSSFKVDTGNWDEFERYLRDLISKSFGAQFVIDNLQISRVPMDNKEICQIRIKKGGYPLILSKKLKSGEKKEVFYFRFGNQSKDIEKLSEFYSYIEKRYFCT